MINSPLYKKYHIVVSRKKKNKKGEWCETFPFFSVKINI